MKIYLAIIFLSVNCLWAKRAMVLEEIVAQAIRSNPDLKGVKHLANASQAKIAPAGVVEDGKIVHSFNREFKEISLEQKIPFPGKLGARKRIAKYGHRTLVQFFLAQEQELIFNVKRIYYQIYFIHQAIKIVKENIGILGQFSGLVKARYQTGKGHQTDFVKVNLRLTVLKLKLIELEKDLSNSEADLNFLLGENIDTQWGRPSVKLILFPFNFKKYTMDYLYQLALKNSPVYARHFARVNGAMEEVNLASLNYWPNFTLATKYHVPKENKNHRKDFVTVSVGVTMPFFFWAKQREEKRVAMEKKLSLEAQKISAEKMLIHHIHHGFLQIKEIYRGLKIYGEEIIPQSYQALHSSRASYKVGTVNFLTLMDSEKEHFKNRLAYEENLSHYYQAMAELEKNIGVPRQKW